MVVTPKKRTAYKAETRAAVIAALLTGQGVESVAAEYKVPKETVKSWRARMRKGALKGAEVAPPEPSKRIEIGALLVDYLHANLTTLKQQQVVFSDPVWLAKQEAGELAVLHGVMTDKAIRLLEALGGAQNG